MKINNPTKFFAAGPEDPNFNDLSKRATIMTRGDVIKKYAVTDSRDNAAWHFTESSDDSWVKFSFDAGNTWPLKFKYKNTLLMKFIDDNRPVAGTNLEFDFSNYSDVDYSSIKNGRISVYALNKNNNGDYDYTTTLPFYRYKFDDATRTLNIILTIDPPEDSEATMVLVELDGHSAMAMAVPTPVFSSFVNFNNTTYSENYGYVMTMGRSSDADDSLYTSTSNFDNVTQLLIKVVSADETLAESKNVVLRFRCGSADFERVIPVTNVETWQEISLPGPLNGALTISRNSDDSRDTLKDNSGVIDCYISNVKAVIFN